MADPVSSFLYGMNTTSQMLRGRRQDEQNERLFNMKMDAYDRALRKEEEAEKRSKQLRETASSLSRIEAGGMTGEDAAQADPNAGFRLGDLGKGEPEGPSPFDEQAQKEGVSYVMNVINRVSKGEPITEEDREPLFAAGGALSTTGVLASTVPEIRQQASLAQGFKDKIRIFGEKYGPALAGKKTVIDAADDPEMFAHMAAIFPSVANGSKAFKEGKSRIVQVYLDGTGANNIQEVRAIPVLEGVNPKTGETYRAPMSLNRSSDPQDHVSATSLGELYAQADFAERAAKSLMAASYGLDDAAAQKYLDHYRTVAQKLAEEKRTLQKNVNISDALSGIAGISEKDKAEIAKAVKSGSDPIKTVEMALKRNDKDLDLDWRKDVLGEDGKPYQVAYDKKTGKEVARIPQWVKGDGSGKGSGGGRGNPLDSNDYKIFDDQLNKQYLAEYLNSLPEEQRTNEADFLETDALGNQRVAMERVVSKMPAEMRTRYNKARQHGEYFMAEGGITPVQAANRAYEYANTGEEQPENPQAPSVFAKASADQVMKALEAIPDVPARLEEVKKYLASDAPEETKEKVRYQYEAQLARIKAGEDRKGRESVYRQGMAVKNTPENVRSRIFENVQRSVPDYGVGPADVAGALGSAYWTFIKNTPVGLMSQWAGGKLQDFRQWAKDRYKAPDDAAFQAYAKERPEQAKIVVDAVVAAQNQQAVK